MKCYECSRSPEPGGLHIASVPAVGICLACGRGVCSEHARPVGPRNELRCGRCCSEDIAGRPIEQPLAAALW